MGGELVAVNAVTDVIKDGMECMKEYAMCRETEITERKRIRAQLEAINHVIDAKKEIALKIVESGYQERKELYDMIQGTINKATEIGDLQMLTLSMDYMMKVYKDAPKLGETNINLIEQTKT